MTASEQPPSTIDDKRAARRERRRAERQSNHAHSLDPADFDCWGFGDRRSALEQKIRGVSLRSDEPSVSIIDNGILIPAADAVVRGGRVGQPRHTGGVINDDGQPVAAANLYRGRQKLRGGLDGQMTVTPAAEVMEDAIYLGWLSNQFGHFLLDSLARVWYLTRGNSTAKVVFHYPPRPAAFFSERLSSIPDWVYHFLAVFGISRDRILVPEVPTRFRRLIIPEPLFTQGYLAHTAFIEPFREAASRLVTGDPPSAQPVYLSRRLLPSRRRPIIGEADIEATLRDHGFRIAYPETMTVEEQIRLVNGHAHIVSNVGSAAHTVLFARNRPALHLLTDATGAPRNFFLCSALAGIPTTLVNCLETRGRSAFGGPQSTPLIATPATVVDYLIDRGLLPEAARTHAARVTPGLSAAYDEAWLYARVRDAALAGETLPAAIEHEALQMTEHSWPISLVLALYGTTRSDNARRVSNLARQFAILADAEQDKERLAHYRAEVESMAPIVALASDDATAEKVRQVVANHVVSDRGDIDA